MNQHVIDLLLDNIKRNLAIYCNQDFTDSAFFKKMSATRYNINLERFERMVQREINFQKYFDEEGNEENEQIRKYR